MALALRVSMEENRARQLREETTAGSTMETATVEPGSASTGNLEVKIDSLAKRVIIMKFINLEI